MELKEIYASFLSQINDDEWSTWEEQDAYDDLYMFLEAAVAWFKFPRVPLNIDYESGTIGSTEPDKKMTLYEKQILVAYMKYLWLERVVNSWENLRPMYSERDFSPAAMLTEFRQKLGQQLLAAKELEARYYRTNGKNRPFPHAGLAGRR